MKIFVKAKPDSKEAKVDKIDDNNFLVAVKEPPVKGLANRAIIAALADYFGISAAQIKIVSGFSSRKKIAEIFK